jgi:hypothetical protein
MPSDVYLGPSPPDPDPSNTIFWGSRAGMYDKIAVREGIDSSHALIKTAPSREDVIQFCREYDSDYSNKCIEQGLESDLPKTLTADCSGNTFTNFTGRKFLLLVDRL